MYGIGGERELHEGTLDHLSGYEGARPVRTGNGAWDQRQHDVWGMLLDSVAIHGRHLGQQMPSVAWELIAGLVEDAAGAWQEPDRGIWEVRGTTVSKVLCWVALDRGAAGGRRAATPSARSDGASWPTRSTPRSASAASTSAASSSSTTRRARSTPRRC